MVMIPKRLEHLASSAASPDIKLKERGTNRGIRGKTCLSGLMALRAGTFSGNYESRWGYRVSPAMCSHLGCDVWSTRTCWTVERRHMRHKKDTEITVFQVPFLHKNLLVVLRRSPKPWNHIGTVESKTAAASLEDGAGCDCLPSLPINPSSSFLPSPKVPFQPVADRGPRDSWSVKVPTEKEKNSERERRGGRAATFLRYKVFLLRLSLSLSLSAHSFRIELMEKRAPPLDHCAVDAPTQTIPNL
ncbi:unnamed protein product [Menidia menidia]|uniref:(Atlantic silverside) hypothetical protein n=1 Tax=Menidia menidia TaxID=238744 RepID=A0A8S4AWK9_9TELE|nr:unnamed protein product [Menidia menidia]